MTTAPDYTITQEVTASKGRYVASAPGLPDAELTYSIANANLIIIDHTGVPDAWRGKGVGKVLVERAVLDARAGKCASCRYAPLRKRRSSAIPNGRTCWAARRNRNPGAQKCETGRRGGCRPVPSRSCAVRGYRHKRE